jgi:hypothetical protein
MSAIGEAELTAFCIGPSIDARWLFCCQVSSVGSRFRPKAAAHDPELTYVRGTEG